MYYTLESSETYVYVLPPNVSHFDYKGKVSPVHLFLGGRAHICFLAEEVHVVRRCFHGYNRLIKWQSGNHYTRGPVGLT